MADKAAIDRINQLRRRILDGETISIEESKEAIDLLRQQRAEATKPKEDSKKDVPLNLNDLF